MGNENIDFNNMLIRPIVEGVISIWKNPVGKIIILVFAALYLIQYFFGVPCFDWSISAIVWLGKKIWSLF